MSHKAIILGVGVVGAYVILKKSAATPTTALGKLASTLGIKPAAPGASIFGTQPTTTNLATKYGTATSPASPSVNTVASATGGFLAGLLNTLTKGSAGSATSNKPGASTGSGTGGSPGGSGSGTPTTGAAGQGFQQPVNDITGSFVTSTAGQVYDPETGLTYVPGSDADPYAGQDSQLSGSDAGSVAGPNDAGDTYGDPMLSPVQPDESATSSTPDAEAGGVVLDDSNPYVPDDGSTVDYGAADLGGDDSGG